MLASPLKNLCVQVAKGLEAIISGLGMPSAASAGGTEAAGAQAQAGAVRQGAWMLLREVAAQDAGAPSWQFLQGCWAQLQGAGNGGGVGGVGWGVCVCGCLCGRVSLCICVWWCGGGGASLQPHTSSTPAATLISHPCSHIHHPPLRPHSSSTLFSSPISLISLFLSLPLPLTLSLPLP